MDAIYLSLQQARTARNKRKVLLVMSDGGDNSSRYTIAEIKDLAREGGIQVYTVGIEPLAGRGQTPETLSGSDLLSQLAQAAGPRHFTVEKTTDLPRLAVEISTSLRTPSQLQ